ncbi:hypothetical protein FIV42_13915 [Persicimonas caeni]|uniref:Uncharacterized protein n=1 Tax=Persicimonas caeni TaxID=2292766 RepID=A0A4Y6PU72_PERCE|nr:hypothetical protein [Persicimonas caeni]QDG51800.1 hypothetical protein FIV42_13915 [Persicimonas caeni]QED33021.1 hypothetical protein FRD00_13910 [Persicimonas caeni]
MHWPTLGKNLLRILLTVGLVCGIAAAFLVLNPSSQDGGVGVESSQADVLWMTPFERTNTQKFAGALQDLGHEPPRAYNLNGNDVYFSTRTSHKSPELLLEEYQRAFVEHGLNSRMWMQSTDQFSRLRGSEAHKKRYAERSEAAINGEILPAVVNNDYMSMTGMVFDKGDAEGETSERAIEMIDQIEQTTEKLSKLYAQCGGDPELVDKAAASLQQPPTGKKLGKAMSKRSSCDGGGPKVCSEWRVRLKAAQTELKAYTVAISEQPELRTCAALRSMDKDTAEKIATDFIERVEGYRSIEAFRDRQSGQTVVTASWSDEEFDMKAVLPDRYEHEGQTDGPVPACESCRQAFNFAGSGGESPYSSNEFWSQESVDRVAVDYIQTLAAEGWELRDGEPIMQQLYGRMDAPAGVGKYLRFARGNKHITLHVRPDREHGRTAVTAFTSN